MEGGCSPAYMEGHCLGAPHAPLLASRPRGSTTPGAPASGSTLPTTFPPQVEVFRKRDAQEGVPVAQVLEGFISRKVVKQTVMTVVYGVTRYGGRLQIEKRLKQIEDFPQVPSLSVCPSVCSSAPLVIDLFT